MAALIVADELSEARQRMRRVEEELVGMQQARVAAADQTESAQANVAAAFNAAAERIEKIVRLLGETVDGHHVVLG
jgi:cell division protein ZapA